ncbi:MAG: MFS transporter [Nocardioides sp.]|uniref:MFS transporter n=1 Tax=Nocardioides sp. TaxID=35761 RepID=UPI0039E61345
MLATATACYTLSQSINLPVMDVLPSRFDTTPAVVTWVVTANLLTATVATPMVGRLGDAWGHRRLLCLSLAALALGSLIAAFAPNIGVLMAARVVQGSGGGVVPLAFAIVRDALPEDRASAGVGLVSASLAVGMALGMVLAGPALASMGYVALFVLPSVAAASAAVAVLKVVPNPSVT